MIGRARRGGRPRWLAFILAIGLMVAGCGSAASPEILSTVGNRVSGEGGAFSGAPAASAAPAAAPDEGSGINYNSGAPGQSDLLVIKTGTLALRVKELDRALSEASAKVAAVGGYVSGSQRSGDGDQAFASATYRIPAGRWDEALTALRGLADKILGEETRTDEVTGQVLDLGARIVNLQATEKALQEIMTKATKIADVLAVQEQLTEVRGQIEQLTTQKKHLEEQAAFGTLTVTYALQGEPAVVIAQKGFDPGAEIDRATASLVAIGQALAAAGIWFGIVWLPVLGTVGIVGLIGFVIARQVRRWRRRAGPGTAVTPTGA